MIKRKLVVFALMFMAILALSTTSAGAFGEWWNKLTGKVPINEDSPSCIDSDGKDNFLVSGYVDFNGNIYGDYCAGDDTETVYDYYCNTTTTTPGIGGAGSTGAVIDDPNAPTTFFDCSINNMRCYQGKCTCIPGQNRSCTGSTVGECNPGTETCNIDGSWGPVCEGFQGPVNEICDGKDNDCDGLIDEGDVCGPVSNCQDGDVQFCGTNIGLCIQGTQTCINGKWSPNPCVPVVGPTEEICDEQDNDCDGVADEGGICIGIPCTNGDTKTCSGNNEGECFPGTETCVNGNWNGACLGKIDPSSETCDQKDNDCDGFVDEEGVCDNCTIGTSQECSGLSFGTCFPGTKTCSSSGWGSCVGYVGPTNEICDNLDNNCNNQVDENKDGNPLTESCGTNVGECIQGTRTCGSGLWGDCIGEIPPADEICDGKDNDCDGVADEGCSCTDGETRECGSDVGECIKGTQVCTNQEWGTICLNSHKADSETCDQKDNDCDGLIDEGEVCDDSSIVDIRTTNAAVCEDTDEKEDIYVQGDVTGTTSSGDAISFQDECLNSKQVAQYSCFRDPDTNDLFLQQKGYNCPAGSFCTDGICESSSLSKSSRSTGTTSTECVGSENTLPLSIDKACFNKNTRDVQITLSKDNVQNIDYLDFFITDNKRDVSILTCGNTCGGCEVIDSGTKSYYIYIDDTSKTPTSLILKSTNCLTDITQIKTC